MFKKFSTITLAVVFLLMFTLSLAILADGELEAKGAINSRPIGGNIGDWDIGGVIYQANASTVFEEHHGALVVGACAEVEYQVVGGVNKALKINSAEAQDCATTPPSGEHTQIYGRIDSFPAGLTGNWVIDGATYTADASTKFEQKHGAFATGQCVDVKYIAASKLIVEIETEADYKCGGNGAPTAQVYGVLESFPPGLIGTWVVSATTYTATTATRFSQDDGDFFVGGCVEVKYETDTLMAIEIETAKAQKCGASGGGDPTESKLYDFIETIPADPHNGVWAVGGQSFTATAQTELKEEHGTLLVGACAEVEYYAGAGGNIATHISTEEAYKCGNGTSMNKIYGKVDSFPAGLYGAWVVDGNLYEADAQTEFKAEHGDFAVDACVKVKYYALGGVNYAAEIETKKAEACGGSPDLPGDSKVYAIIDSFPPSIGGTMGTLYPGEWIIGGVSYTATAQTKYEEEHGSFSVGVCVKAKYTVVNGSNVLKEVETKEVHKCQGTFKSFGAVEIMPGTPAYTGTWQISGITYTADANTKFEQEHGFFAVGAYVEVKYNRVGGVNYAIEIATHVEPGHGSEHVIGVLDSKDADDWGNWVVNGVSYTGDPAIEVGVGNAAPVVGKLVSLNTYQSAGQTYITQAQQPYQVFLPVLVK